MDVVSKDVEGWVCGCQTKRVPESTDYHNDLATLPKAKLPPPPTIEPGLISSGIIIFIGLGTLRDGGELHQPVLDGITCYVTVSLFFKKK